MKNQVSLISGRSFLILYSGFRNSLKIQNLAYEGMIFRELAENSERLSGFGRALGYGSFYRIQCIE